MHFVHLSFCFVFFFVWKSKLKNEKWFKGHFYLMKIKSIYSADTIHFGSMFKCFRSIGDSLFQLSKLQQKLYCITFKSHLNESKCNNKMSIYEMGYILWYIETLSCTVHLSNANNWHFLIKRQCFRTFIIHLFINTQI